MKCLIILSATMQKRIFVLPLFKFLSYLTQRALPLSSGSNTRNFHNRYSYCFPDDKVLNNRQTMVLKI